MAVTKKPLPAKRGRGPEAQKAAEAARRKREEEEAERLLIEEQERAEAAAIARALAWNAFLQVEPGYDNSRVKRFLPTTLSVVVCELVGTSKTSKPCVELEFMGESYHSRVIPQEKPRTFYQEHTFSILPQKRSEFERLAQENATVLNIIIRDHNSYMAQAVLGKVQIPLAGAKWEGERWYDLDTSTQYTHKGWRLHEGRERPKFEMSSDPVQSSVNTGAVKASSPTENMRNNTQENDGAIVPYDPYNDGFHRPGTPKGFRSKNDFGDDTRNNATPSANEHDQLLQEKREVEEKIEVLQRNEESIRAGGQKKSSKRDEEAARLRLAKISSELEEHRTTLAALQQAIVGPPRPPTPIDDPPKSSKHLDTRLIKENKYMSLRLQLRSTSVTSEHDKKKYETLSRIATPASIIPTERSNRSDIFDKLGRFHGGLGEENISEIANEEDAVYATTLRHEKGRTELHRAALSGNLLLVSGLIEHGADVDSLDADKQTPLHLASAEGKLNVVQRLVKSNANVNARSRWLSTPLHLAAAHGRDNVVEFLMKSGAQETKDKWGDSALHISASNGHDGVSTLLLEAGFDVSSPNNMGRTPLQAAEANNQASVLVAYKNIGQKDQMNEENAALEAAVKEEYERVLREDIAKGKNAEATLAAFKRKKKKAPNADDLNKLVARGNEKQRELDILIQENRMKEMSLEEQQENTNQNPPMQQENDLARASTALQRARDRVEIQNQSPEVSKGSAASKEDEPSADKRAGADKRGRKQQKRPTKPSASKRSKSPPKKRK